MEEIEEAKKNTYEVKSKKDEKEKSKKGKGDFIKSTLAKLRDEDPNKGQLPAHKVELSNKDKSKKRQQKHKKNFCDEY